MPIQQIIVNGIAERRWEVVFRHVNEDEVYEVTPTTCTCGIPQDTGQKCIHQSLVDAADSPAPGKTHEFPPD